MRSALSGVLRDEGYQVEAVESGEACLERRRRARRTTSIVLDIWLPGLDGLATLERLRQRQVDAPVVMISGHGNIESAVRAIKMGAFDFVEKPLSLEKTVLVVGNAVRQRRLEAENRALRAHVDRRLAMVGESYVMQQLREQIAMAAPTNGRVLIYGENGTGKELVARSVHAMSRRRSGPFVEVNCAAIPEELIESELFGHVKGAFTGAHRGSARQVRAGRRRHAVPRRDRRHEPQDAGEGAARAAGAGRRAGRRRRRACGSTCACSRRPTRICRRRSGSGRFREDLYFRLNVIPIFVPPLRERPDDIPLLAEHFLTELAREYGRRPKQFDAGAAAGLRSYRWPGNVRELRNVVERLMIMVPGDTITAGGPVVPRRAPAIVDRRTSRRRSRRCTRRAIGSSGTTSCKALAAQQGNISRTADVLGVERSNLYRKMRGFGIAPARRVEGEEEPA